MSSKYKFVNDGHAYFVSLAVVYWIDLLTRTEYCKTILESWCHCEKEKGLKLYAYCSSATDYLQMASERGVKLLGRFYNLH
jgi:putative transposase